MYKSLALASLSLFGAATAQQVGKEQTETHPKMSWSTCTGTGGTSCTTKSASITLDSNWRWSHVTSGYTNCYTDNAWNETSCADPSTCAKNCAIDGADYSGTYGISTSGNALTLKFVTKGSYSTNVGSRTYLMDGDSKYQMFNVIGKEFTFDVDVSKLPCGLNGALYFVEMPSDGGMNKGNNKAGAKYGTGYCDAQCPHDVKWINGVANSKGWTPNPNDKNAGSGELGACCPEMDIWEANSISSAYTPHPCSKLGLTACTGTECGDGDERYSGTCDKDGCDINTFRMGVPDFYGKGKTIDTTKKFTVVTQFIGSGTDLTDIKRFWVQDGKTYATPDSAYPEVPGNSITDDFCDKQKTHFQDKFHFKELGGLKQMAASLAKGHVLVMSLWDDHSVNMLWLDSTYPTDKDPATAPGVGRGECSIDSGKPEDVESKDAASQVTFSNIKFGPIGSTFKPL